MPHLRTLVERYDSRPFAIVGINAFDSEEDYRRGLKDNKVNWISAYQRGTAIISDLYRVSGYPTMLLVDHEGKILARGSHIDDADIERAVVAAEKTSK